MVRVREFKEKSNQLKRIMDSGDTEKYEMAAEDLRKDEKKLGVSIYFTLLLYFTRT